MAKTGKLTVKLVAIGIITIGMLLVFLLAGELFNSKGHDFFADELYKFVKTNE